MDMFVKKLTAENVLLEGVEVGAGIIPHSDTPSLIVPEHSGLPMYARRDTGEIVIQNFGRANDITPTLWQFQLVRDNVYYIFSTRNGGVLQPMGKSSEIEAPIVTASRDGDVFQQWEFIRVSPSPGTAPVDIFNIRNIGSGYYLDVFQDNREPGAQFIQFRLLTDFIYNQRFNIVPFGPPFNEDVVLD